MHEMSQRRGNKSEAPDCLSEASQHGSKYVVRSYLTTNIFRATTKPFISSRYK